ncbi:peptidase M23 [Micromonospora rosaria]|uniref:Peptidase M23 n=2 Tax=Micromonospora rosaria TaxID=47874 RepID=A0A136PLQ0_9ACTN|nr:M23 family metallopeptidase [Micromonospora rosaria]KXK59293.1 peptidase M23 [Micromonospora rosaria]
MRPRSAAHRRLRSAYPVLLLAVATVAAGCAASRELPEPPRWESPGAPLTADQAAPGDRSATPTAAASPTGTPSVDPSPTRSGLRHVFPVRADDVDYHPTHSAYPGTDLFADCGEPFVAVTDGRILEVSRVDRYSKRGPQGPHNGGLSVSLLGDDGVRYYGSHLRVIASGIDEGARVRAGQQLGEVGRTGNANNVCHVHFGISPPCTGSDDWWIRRGVIWPAKYLDSWRRGGNREPAAEVIRWQREHGCPREP